MKRSLIDFITKLSLCGILVLIFVVLFNIIKEPYSMQANGYQSNEEVKAALDRTNEKGKELDKDFMDDYVERLDSPDSANIAVDQRNNYYVPLPQEYSVVNYGTSSSGMPAKKKQ